MELEKNPQVEELEVAVSGHKLRPIEYGKDIAEALVKAQSEIIPAEKSGHHTMDGGYDYSKLSDYHKVVQNPCKNNGLAVTFHQDGMEFLSDIKTRSGKIQKVCKVYLTAVLMHKSGQSINYPGYGLGVGFGDKSLYIAITGGKKYLLANIFNIPTEDDPEQNIENDAWAERSSQTKKVEEIIEQIGTDGKINPKYQSKYGLISINKLATIQKEVESNNIPKEQFIYWINKTFNPGNPPIKNGYNIKAEWVDTIILMLKENPKIIKNTAPSGDDVAPSIPTESEPVPTVDDLQKLFKDLKISKKNAFMWLDRYLTALGVEFNDNMNNIPAKSLPEIYRTVKDYPGDVK